MRNSAVILLASMALILGVSSCGNKGTDGTTDSLPTETPPLDTLVADIDTISAIDSVKTIEDIEVSTDGINAYINSLPDADRYQGGILPVIANNAPEYARKLVANKYSRFLVVDKASMRVLLYDRYGQLEKAYDMACAKNYGNKHKKADSRTPEGFFSVEGIYNSTDWLFTDDDGKTSKKKGQFGPRFIRLRIPTTSQIGIHGTCAPWSIGHRTSHGCIRITNENILELVELVEPGMPAIVLPGKRDRAVNREEGFASVYFPTNPKYAISEAEKKLTPRTAEEIEAEKARELEKQMLQELQENKESLLADSIGCNSHEKTDSI
ncbi:MAG: L,D-transpeptidase [Muribaculaceae bacterium]|nr:L,D-transpeptidase [Muribaculaceae bacterium]